MSKPLIVFLRLEDYGALEELNGHLLFVLATQAEIRHAKTPLEARRYLSSTTRPHAIIVVDAAVTYPEYRDILLLLEEYVKSGGTAVYAGIFSALVRSPDFEFVFKDVWGLPWRVGGGTSEDQKLNPRFKAASSKELVQRYNVNATYISNVALSAAIYLKPGEVRKLQKGKARAEDGNATYTTTAAFSPVGKGRVGYIGDVNAQPETTPIILAMCFYPGSRAPIVPGTGLPPPLTSQTLGVTVPSSSSTRRVLIISLKKDGGYVDRTYGQLYRAFRMKAETTEVLTKGAAIDALAATPGPDAVLVSDAAITTRKFAEVLASLIKYAQGGGTVVLGMQFSSELTRNTTRAFFARWGLPWDLGDYFRTTFALNPAGIPAPLSSSALQPTLSMKACHIKNALREEAVYLASETSHVESHVFAPTRVTGAAAAQSPAVFARVGSGHLGYVGDVNAEQGSIRILIEMCGVKIEPGDMGSRRITASISMNRGVMSETMATEEEIPLSALPTFAAAPREQAVAPRERDAEVAARHAKREKNREDKLRRAELLKVQGNDLFVLEKWAEAAEKYRDAALLAGPRPVFLSNLAASLLKMKLWDVADDAASRALVYDPVHVKALYRRAQARKELDRLTAAESDLKRVLAIDSTNTAARAEQDDIRKRKQRTRAREWPCDAQPATTARGSQAVAAVDIETEDESDSEDFAHAGNGTPCKFYNHAGCLYGSHCRFKHTPDARSIRDELGRNVCVYWLLGECRFGDRCVYTHEKAYLPAKGWWTDDRRLASLRKEFNDAVKASSMSFPTETAESIMPETLRPVPWRRDLWAVASYTAMAEVVAIDEHNLQATLDEFGISLEDGEEESEVVLDDGDEAWEDEEEMEDWERELEERAEYCGHTRADFEEMITYGIRPYDIDAYEELNSVRAALGELY